ncbi:MAG: hypothetical protein ABEJ58_02075, partial [Halodesulfurarchaeum sp.]
PDERAAKPRVGSEPRAPVSGTPGGHESNALVRNQIQESRDDGRTAAERPTGGARTKANTRRPSKARESRNERAGYDARTVRPGQLRLSVRTVSLRVC